LIIDANVYLGTWALRQVSGGSGAEALEMMGRYHIDKAFVSSMRGVMYRNPQEANRELMDDIRGCEDRLIPFAVINPAYPGWEDDFEDCFEASGFKGVKIHPGYHGYRITDDFIRPFFKLIAGKGLPVSYSARMEEGVEHWALRGLINPTGAEIDELLNELPDLRLLITDLIGFDEIFKHLSPRDNLYVDISHVRRGDELETLCRRFEPERLLFGTGYPFRYPDSPMIALDYAHLELGVREGILGFNALKFMSE
jgi:hypothetical protein